MYTIAPKDEYSTKLIAEGVTFIPLKLNNYSTNPIDDLRLFIQLWRLYRKLQLDLIFHYTIKPNIYGSIAAKLAKTERHVAITTGLGKMFRFESSLANRLSIQLYRAAAKCTDEMWFLNTEDRNKFVAKGILGIEKSRVLPSEGIDTNKYRAVRPYRESKITRFLFAGRLLYEKGIQEYVDTARIMRRANKNLRFEILGYIDEKNQNSVSLETLKAWQQEGIIKYLGSTEDVRPFVDRADCVVLPSYYQEGISRILMEAASMSTPIITTDNIGCEDVVIHNWNGYIAKKNSVDSLVENVRAFLLLNYKERCAMGDRGRELVKQKYQEDKILLIYQNFMHDHRYLRAYQPKND